MRDPAPALAAFPVPGRQGPLLTAIAATSGASAQDRWLAGLHFGRTITTTQHQDVLTVICPIDTTFLWALGIALCFTLVLVGRTGSLRRMTPWVLILLLFGVIAGITTSHAEVVLDGPASKVSVTTVLFFRAKHEVFPLSAFQSATVGDSDQSDALRIIYKDGADLQLTPFNQQHGKSEAAYAITQFLNQHLEAAAVADTIKAPAVTWGPESGRLNIAARGLPYALALPEGLVQFCDADGGHSVDVHSGLVRSSIAECRHTEPDTACSIGKDRVEVRTPNLEGVQDDHGSGPPLAQDDILDVEGQSFPLHGHVQDCAVEGSILAAVTSQEIILIDLKTSRALLTLPFGGDRIALGNGYLGWLDNVVHVIPRPQ